MWLMTNFGAFSVVRAQEDPEWMVVRARRRRDLMRLRRRYLPELGRIYSTPHRDYQFRAFCTPSHCAEAMSKVALDIDYDNFKDSVKDHKLHEAYSDIWYTLWTAFYPFEIKQDYPQHNPTLAELYAE